MFACLFLQVLHSMRIREKSLIPRIVATKDGVIKAAQCSCQAGLGESCSHVAALMFSLDIKVRLRDSKTVTEKPAYWMLPQAVKKINYNELREIDFSTAKTIKKKFDSFIENSEPVQQSQNRDHNKLQSQQHKNCQTFIHLCMRHRPNQLFCH